MTTSKQKRPSLTSIRKVMKEAVFNPKTPGPMKVVADMDDAGYFEKRAIESIFNASALRVAGSGESKLYHAQITKAIQLLALARITA